MFSTFYRGTVDPLGGHNTVVDLNNLADDELLEGAANVECCLAVVVVAVY